MVFTFSLLPLEGHLAGEDLPPPQKLYCQQSAFPLHPELHRLHAHVLPLQRLGHILLGQACRAEGFSRYSS